MLLCYMKERDSSRTAEVFPASYIVNIQERRRRVLVIFLIVCNVLVGERSGEVRVHVESCPLMRCLCGTHRLPTGRTHGVIHGTSSRPSLVAVVNSNCRSGAFRGGGPSVRGHGSSTRHVQGVSMGVAELAEIIFILRTTLASFPVSHTPW